MKQELRQSKNDAMESMGHVHRAFKLLQSDEFRCLRTTGTAQRSQQEAMERQALDYQ